MKQDEDDEYYDEEDDKDEEIKDIQEDVNDELTIKITKIIEEINNNPYEF